MSEVSGPLVLGTRGSELALTQTELVKAQLAQAGIDRPVETKIIATTGDKRQDLKLSATNLDKAVFTKELEDALEAGEIHAAVHSLKDVPTEIDPKFKLVAVLERSHIEDVLITKNPDHALSGLDSLPFEATVATSSVRRQHQLQYQRPDLKIVDIRGNVPTRLRKVATLDGIDATILAWAGLARLDYDLSASSMEFEGKDLGIHILNPKIFIPAAGQGAVAIECRANDKATAELMGQINHQSTWLRIKLERAFLDQLGAGCQTPVGIHTEMFDYDHWMHVWSIVFQGESAQPILAQANGPTADLPRILKDLMKQFHG